MSKRGGAQVKTRRRKSSYKRTLKSRGVPRAHNRFAPLRRPDRSYSAYLHSPKKGTNKAWRKKLEEARLDLQRNLAMMKREENAEQAEIVAARRRMNQLRAKFNGNNSNNSNNNNNNGTRKRLQPKRSAKYSSKSLSKKQIANQQIASMFASAFKGEKGAYSLEGEIRKRQQEMNRLKAEEARLKAEEARLEREEAEREARLEREEAALKRRMKAAEAARKEAARLTRLIEDGNNGNNNNNGNNEMMTVHKKGSKGKKGSRKGKNGLANFFSNFGRFGKEGNNGMGI